MEFFKITFALLIFVSFTKQFILTFYFIRVKFEEFFVKLIKTIKINF